MKRITIILTAVLACASGGVWAHSGGTDSQGCHIDHKTGIRHCH
ncbi:YHYH domain-containing protein (plasmid) [Cupriavidus pauculus]|nr:YHYH domain-containing protein [Cupriavidus pauculus]UAL03790.1 YHYH domain-containing protein [Cupriavidus pauculus]